MNKSLTKEIINHIFTILGIWNNNGILSEHYLTQEKITGKYEDGQNFYFPIWAAELKTSDKTSLRCVVSDITDNGNNDSEVLPDSEREKELIAIFARNNVEVEFI